MNITHTFMLEAGAWECGPSAVYVSSVTESGDLYSSLYLSNSKTFFGIPSIWFQQTACVALTELGLN